MTSHSNKDEVVAALTGRYIDFYQSYTLLKKSGGEWRGPCPLHGGDGPSFTVKPETGEWYCHSRGCGKPGGDMFHFLMLKDGLTFPEALAQVAVFAGVSESFVSEQQIRPAVVSPTASSPIAISPAPLDPCLAEELHEHLMRWDWMKGWLLDERGLTTETLKRFRVGLHKDNRDRGYYRITFPVYDRRGKLMNIRRHLFGYLPELHLPAPEKPNITLRDFLGKTRPWRLKDNWFDLYPLSVLDDATEAMIVEGEADALLAVQMGFTAVTGTMGAGSWKDHWTEELCGFQRVTILYDNDQAGQDGAQKVAAYISRVVADVRIAKYDALPGIGGAS